MRRPYLSLKQTPHDVRVEGDRLFKMQTLLNPYQSEKAVYFYIWRLTPLQANDIANLYEEVRRSGGAILDQNGTVTIKLARVYTSPGWVEYAPFILYGVGAAVFFVTLDRFRICFS